MSTVSAQARDELVKAIRDRYLAGSPSEKRRILDEFVALTGYHRKHAIRVLRSASAAASPSAPRQRVYDDAVRDAIVVLWEASDRICGKRLKALLPTLVPALERHGHLQLDEAVRSRLMAASAATIDRMLARHRMTAQGRRRRPRARSASSKAIAIRTFGDWKDPEPGFLEIDLVAHCGDHVGGSFAHTLVLTDIASGWTECVALLVREGTLVADGLERLRTSMPFPLRGIDSDNGGEFINETVLAYCAEHKIEFTRARPHHKNDQAWVEQKNGSIVRRLVGYGRLEGVRAADALARLYTASRLFVNFFQPSFKLAEKVRIGARVKKRYHAPETPCARLLARPSVDEKVKERLRVVLATLDPLRLLDEIRTVQQHLAGLAAGELLHVLLTAMPTLIDFCGALRRRGWMERFARRIAPEPSRRVTGAPERTRSTRRGPRSRRGWRRNPTGLPRSCLSVSRLNSPACSPTGSFGHCNVESKRGGDSRPVASSSRHRTPRCSRESSGSSLVPRGRRR